MGYKTVKEHYGIKHIVAIYEERESEGKCICIGSPLCHNLIVIRISDAKVTRRYSGNSNEYLPKYNEALLRDQENGILRKLIDKEDVFDKSLPVYTINDYHVVKEYCEEYGWPNVTHAGNMMYDNTYFRTKEEAYRYLLRDTSSRVRYCRTRERIREALEKIGKTIAYSAKNYWYWVLARTVGYFYIKEEK